MLIPTCCSRHNRNKITIIFTIHSLINLQYINNCVGFPLKRLICHIFCTEVVRRNDWLLTIVLYNNNNNKHLARDLMVGTFSLVRSFFFNVICLLTRDTRLHAGTSYRAVEHHSCWIFLMNFVNKHNLQHYFIK